MKIDRSRVTGARFMFAVAYYLQSSALLTSFLGGVTKHESWIPLAAGIVLCIPLILLYRTLMVMFPEKNFVQMLETVFGKVAGTAMGVLYLWFFVTLSALNIRDLGNFAKISILSNTPNEALTLLCAVVAVWAVRHGFKVVGRYGGLFTVLQFSIVGATLVLLVNQMDVKNLLPLWVHPVSKYVQGTHIISTIPIGELVIFLMVTPCVKMSPKEATKYWLLGFFMGMGTLLVVLVRDILVLGNTLHLFTLPGLVTLRLVNMGEALSRMEILFAIALIILLFFKITVLFYVSTICLAQIFKTRAYRHLAMAVAALILAYSATLYPNPVAHYLAAHAYVPIIWTLFEIGLPILTFVVAKLRKLPAQEKPAAAGQEG